MKIVTNFLEFVNENISNVFNLMKSTGIQWMKYTRIEHNRKGVRDLMCHVAFYKGFIVANASLMREFTNDVLKFIKKMKFVDEYIDKSFKNVKKIDSNARLRFYHKYSKYGIDNKYMDSRNIDSPTRFERATTSLCLISFAYKKYIGRVELQLKAFTYPDNIIHLRDIDDETYTEEKISVTNLENLGQQLDLFFENKIIEWKNKIEDKASAINSCPEYILKRIYGDKIIKMKNIGMFED